MYRTTLFMLYVCLFPSLWFCTFSKTLSVPASVLYVAAEECRPWRTLIQMYVMKIVLSILFLMELILKKNRLLIPNPTKDAHWGARMCWHNITAILYQVKRKEPATMICCKASFTSKLKNIGFPKLVEIFKRVWTFHTDGNHWYRGRAKRQWKALTSIRP